MRLFRVHKGPRPEPDRTNPLTAHVGDYPTEEAARAAATLYADGGQPLWLEPVEWNESTTEPTFVNVGEVVAIEVGE